MSCSITDEIIDAIIQNEQRHVCRPRGRHASVRLPQAAGNLASLKPEWSQLPPGWAENAGRPDPGWPDPGWPDPGWPDPGWPDPERPDRLKR
jgi:hypothetical protein